VSAITIIAVLVLVAAAVVCLVVFMFVGLWIQAKASGLSVSILRMLLMRLRRVDPAHLVNANISLAKAGIDVDIGNLEAHVLAGGGLDPVVDALIAAEKAGLDVDFRRVAAMDLAGRNVVDAVSTRVRPKVLLCPPAHIGQHAIAGVSRDGVRLGVRARVTVRTYLERLVGGAGEETIVARVGEGIVAAIGRADSHREILEKPDTISEYLLAKGLDSGTCFEILSVDIADVDVMDNVGARLRSIQADTDKRIAQAQAEVRRAAAVASRQEMKAKTKEMEGRVVAAKANVPLALSSALFESNLGSHRPVARTMDPRMRWKAGGA